jgi:tetratricopeptide (TPR) repeat protein
MNNRASAYWSLKQLDKSIPLFEETLKLHEAKLGRDHPGTLMTMANLGVNYMDAGRLAEALPLLEEVYRSPKKSPTLRWVGRVLFDGCVAAGKTEQAAALAKELMAEARTRFPKESPQLAGELASLGSALLRVKAFTEAEPFIRECLAIREKTQPEVWSTFNTKSMLGGALLGQKKYAEAESLLLAGYQGMKQREKMFPPQGNTRIPEAIDRLVELYTAINKPEEVKKWMAERAKYPVLAPVPREKK